MSISTIIMFGALLILSKKKLLTPWLSQRDMILIFKFTSSAFCHIMMQRISNLLKSLSLKKLSSTNLNPKRKNPKRRSVDQKETQMMSSSMSTTRLSTWTEPWSPSAPVMIPWLKSLSKREGICTLSTWIRLEASCDNRIIRIRRDHMRCREILLTAMFIFTSIQLN